MKTMLKKTLTQPELAQDIIKLAALTYLKLTPKTLDSNTLYPNNSIFKQPRDIPDRNRTTSSQWI
jgi:hypothetical protein